MQKSRTVQSVKQALPTTPKKRVAVMASYLSNKHSPTVKSLEKLNFVASPEDKINTQLGNAVIKDIRELVDQTKNSRSDCARTTLSKNLTVFKIINGGCLRVCFNFVSILSFTFGFFQAFFSFVLSLFSLFYSRGCFGITTATTVDNVFIADNKYMLTIRMEMWKK
jgi:hypothetical protein